MSYVTTLRSRNKISFSRHKNLTTWKIVAPLGKLEDYTRNIKESLLTIMFT